MFGYFFIMEQLFELFYKTSGVCTDTRSIAANSLFVALKGDNFDGNEFAQKAIELGAKFAIVDDSNKANGKNRFYVKDSLLFLQKLALFHRRKFAIPVIGITGSNGKTTSKELISVVLQQKYNVHFTKGNLNNHIGVPLTLLGLKNEHEIAIIEMGANKPGDIAELCDIAEPTHGIITNIGSAHLEGFGNIEGVISTKTALFRYLAKISGVIVANADDDTICSKLPKNTSNHFYSEKENSEVIGKLIRQNPFVTLSWKSNRFLSGEVETKLVGKYNFYNFLAAITFGHLFDVNPIQINTAIEEYTPTNNRSQIKKTAFNTLIIDCYNANPTSVEAALNSFDLMEATKKTVILGDMLELGSASLEEHGKVIQFLKNKNWNVYLVGKEFGQYNPSIDIHFFENTILLKAYLQENQIQNELILIKGSRGIRLEILADFL